MSEHDVQRASGGRFGRGKRRWEGLAIECRRPWRSKQTFQIIFVPRAVLHQIKTVRGQPTVVKEKITHLAHTCIEYPLASDLASFLFILMCAMLICMILSAVASEYFNTYEGIWVLVPEDIQLCARAFLTKYQLWQLDIRVIKDKEMQLSLSYIRHLLHTQFRDLHSIDCNHNVPTANSAKVITLATDPPI